MAKQSAAVPNNGARKTALVELQKEFDVIENSLAAAIDNAQAKLTALETIWNEASGASRFSCLKYLQELSSLIDREAIGLDLKQLIMNRKNIILNGEVRNYPELKIFEKELSKSKFFRLGFIPQEKKFEIKLFIKTEEEVSP